MASHTFLAAVGDVNDPITWSGIPYHFLQAAKADGLIDEGLPLNASGPEWTRRRVLWNLGRVLTLRGKGGYRRCAAGRLGLLPEARARKAAMGFGSA